MTGITFAEKVIEFCRELDFEGNLPEGINIMNPFRDNPLIMNVIEDFYRKFYNDYKKRHLILGINPGRFGAGVTGIPFTDTKRLKSCCGLSVKGVDTFETSSVFVYEMIAEYGGVKKFYSDFFISAVSPLGFTVSNNRGKDVNYNYYDSRELADKVHDFIIESLKIQLDFGIETNVCFCLGTGKNFKFLKRINDELKIFNTLIPLEHPRYIMQYRTKQKEYYIQKYLHELGIVKVNEQVKE